MPRIRNITIHLVMAIAVVMTAHGCAASKRHQATKVIMRQLELPTHELLLPVAEFNQGRPLVAEQLVTMRRGQNQQVMRINIEAAKDRLVLVGSSPLGATLFQLVFEDGVLKMSGNERGIAAKALLIHFQLVYWPLLAVQERLGKAGFTVTEGQGNMRSRRITYGKADYIAITYSDTDPWRSEVVIRSQVHQYVVEVKTISIDQ